MKKGKVNTMNVDYVYDVGRGRDKFIKEFLAKYNADALNTMDELKAVSKNNITILRLYKEYLDQYRYIATLLYLLTLYFGEYVDQYKEVNKDISDNIYMMRGSLIRLSKSLHSQRTICHMLGSTVKKVSYDTKTFSYIKADMDQMIERLDRVRHTTIDEYIAITPLYDYNKILEAKGISIYDDILDNHSISDDEIYDNIKAYADHVNETIGDSSEYKHNFDEYYKVFLNHKDIIRKEKEEQEKQKLNEKIERAQVMIQAKCDAALRHYDQMSNKSDIGPYDKTIIMKLRVYDFKKTTGCSDCKVIAILSINAKKSTELKYYKSKASKLTSTGYTRADLFKLSDPIPKELLEAADANGWVISEMVF